MDRVFPDDGLGSPTRGGGRFQNSFLIVLIDPSYHVKLGHNKIVKKQYKFETNTKDKGNRI